MEKALKYYYIVGGMPEVVAKWVETHNFEQVEKLQDNILEDSDLYKNFKGAFTENFVLLELIKQGINPYFWRSGNSAELDFLFEYEDMIIPVEAKAEIHTRAKSYREYCKKYAPQIGFKFSMKNVGDNDVEGTKTYSVPLYLVWKIKKYLL